MWVQVFLTNLIKGLKMYNKRNYGVDLLRIILMIFMLIGEKFIII